jgi:hypothetical protein
VTPEFWQRIVEVTDEIGARRPEDLILVLYAESKLNPATTKPFRPNIKPRDWADYANICAQEGTGRCGALGINTIEGDVARALGLSASEFWGLPDLDPTSALYYTALYFNAIRRNTGRKGFSSALELYLANAGANLLKYKITASTVIYNEEQTRSNPALDMNHDNVVTVQDMNDLLVQIIWPQAMPMLTEFNQSQAAKDRVARLYQGGALQPLYHPTGTGADTYAPTNTDTAIAQINAELPDAPSIPGDETDWVLVGIGAAAIIGIATAFAFAVSTTPGKRKRR